MKSRAGVIQKTRTTIAELREKYGLALPSLKGEPLLQQATRLGIVRKIISGAAKTIIPCRLELKDRGVSDPCLIVPSSLPVELLPAHAHIAVGGQILSLTSSAYALPKYVMDAAWRPQGSWKGEQYPVLVSIRGEYRYLVRPNSTFFRFAEYKGADLDHSSPSEPNEIDMQLGRYNWGDDLSSELTVVLAEI